MTEDPSGMISSFSTREVADLLGSSPEQVRRLARSAFIEADRGPQGRLVFSFQDVSLLRTALKLAEARIPPRRIRVALNELRRQVPEERPLSAIAVAVDGDEVIARDERSVWNPESGQTHFDFMAAPLGADAPAFESDGPTFEIIPASETEAAADESEGDDLQIGRRRADQRGAEDWYQLGCSLEDAAVDEAESAFRKALAIMPAHRGAHLALGYLLHQSDRLDEAVQHYRLAADADEADGLAVFNLGVALEDLECPEEATRAYERAVAADPELADAHYNLGRLYEEAGERAAAFEHFRRYKHLKSRETSQ